MEKVSKDELIKESDSLIALMEDVSAGKLIDTICVYKTSKIISNLIDIKNYFNNQTDTDRLNDALNIIENAANKTGVEQVLSPLKEGIQNLSNMLTITNDETSERLQPMIDELINILSKQELLDQFQAKMDEFSEAVEDIKRNDKDDDFTELRSLAKEKKQKVGMLKF